MLVMKRIRENTAREATATAARRGGPKPKPKPKPAATPAVPVPRTTTLLTCTEYAAGLDLERRFMLDHSGSRVGGKHEVRGDHTFEKYAMEPPERFTKHAAARLKERGPNTTKIYAPGTRRSVVATVVPTPEHRTRALHRQRQQWHRGRRGGTESHGVEVEEEEEEKEEGGEPPCSWDPHCEDLPCDVARKVVCLAIPSQTAGRVIGARGLNLKSLQAHFHVSISADPMMPPPVAAAAESQPAGRLLHRVTISQGTPRAREAAAGRIRQLVMKLHKRAATAEASAAPASPPAGGGGRRVRRRRGGKPV